MVAREANLSLALTLIVPGVVYQAANHLDLVELATSLLMLGGACIGATIGRALDRRLAIAKPGRGRPCSRRVSRTTKGTGAISRAKHP
jgi:hypothetical protein